MSAGREGARYVPALGFAWLTPFYDSVVGITTRERTFKSALIEQAAIRPGERVLDLACGTATLSIMAQRAQPEARITGLDGDPEILAIARRKAAAAGVEIGFDQGLSDQLPYADGSFDQVLCSLFFHHLERRAKQATFREIVRILKPGGVLHVADWGQAATPLMRFAFFGIQLLDGFANTADNVQGLLPQFMREAGLTEVEERRRFSTMWGTLSLYRASPPN